MKTFLLSTTFFFFSFITLVFPYTVHAQVSKFYNLTLLYTQGKFEQKSISVFPGEISEAIQQGDYRVELLSLTGKILYSNHFQASLFVHGEEIDPKTGQFVARTVQQDNAEIIVNIPYSTDGKEIDIYDMDNKKILTIPVGYFAEVTPTPISPTPEFKVTKMEKGIGIPWVIGGGILIFVITAVGLIVYFKFKKPQNQLR